MLLSILSTERLYPDLFQGKTKKKSLVFLILRYRYQNFDVHQYRSTDSNLKKWMFKKTVNIIGNHELISGFVWVSWWTTTEAVFGNLESGALRVDWSRDVFVMKPLMRCKIAATAAGGSGSSWNSAGAAKLDSGRMFTTAFELLVGYFWGFTLNELFIEWQKAGLRSG